MEVVTKVACGSVIAGGGGAAGAYGIHRWRASHEQESGSDVVAPQTREEVSALPAQGEQTGERSDSLSGDTRSQALADNAPSTLQNQRPEVEAESDQTRSSRNTDSGTNPAVVSPGSTVETSGSEKSKDTEGGEGNQAATTVNSAQSGVQNSAG